MEANLKSWTPEYMGVSHLESTCRKYRVTLNNRSDSGFCEISLWVPGCGFSPERRDFFGEACLESAKVSGEKWLASMAGSGVAA